VDLKSDLSGDVSRKLPLFYATLVEDKKNKQLLCVSYKNLKTNGAFERKRLWVDCANYTPQGIKMLKEIYDKANLKVLR